MIAHNLNFDYRFLVETNRLHQINETVKAILDYNPNILFTVDSPDFTLRVAEKVKKINPKIKIIHYVAPQVWVWREGRVKKLKNFVDHILLLFNFSRFTPGFQDIAI